MTRVSLWTFVGLGALLLTAGVLFSLRGVRSPSQPPGMCGGRDVYTAFRRRELGAVQYADNKGAERRPRRILVDTPKKCFEVHCRDDQWDGAYTAWHEDGTRFREGGYRQGQRDGAWREWAPDGGLLGAAFLIAGNGHWVDRHDNGTPAAEGELVAGVEEGTWRYWSISGALLETVEVVKGQREGLSVWYALDGGVRRSARYMAGRDADGGLAPALPDLTPCGP